MMSWVKALATKPDEQTSVPKTHTVARKTPLKVSSAFHTHTMDGTHHATDAGHGEVGVPGRGDTAELTLSF